MLPFSVFLPSLAVLVTPGFGSRPPPLGAGAPPSLGSLPALCLLSGPSCHRHRSPSLYPAPQCWRSSELLPRTCVRILSFSQATWLHSPPLSPQTSLLSSRLLQPTARYTRLRLPTGRSQLACPTLKASSPPPRPAANLAPLLRTLSNEVSAVPSLQPKSFELSFTSPPPPFSMFNRVSLYVDPIL